MLKLLNRISRPLFFVPAILLFLFFSQYLFPKYNQQIAEVAGKKLKNLDVRVSYTKEEVATLFQEMGTEGRQIYYFLESRIDMIFPLIYGPMFLMLFAFFFKKWWGSESRMLYLSFLPASTMLFDIMENLNILKLLKNHDQLTDQMVALASTFTGIKMILFVTSLLGILLISAFFILRFLFIKFKSNFLV